MNNKLNKLLANLVVEYHKLQNYHWYVKGKDFFQAHAKLEELYNHINGAVDEVADVVGDGPLSAFVGRKGVDVERKYGLQSGD